MTRVETIEDSRAQAAFEPSRDDMRQMEFFNYRIRWWQALWIPTPTFRNHRPSVFFFFFCGKKLFFGKVLIERRFLPHSANLRDINRKTKPDLRRCLIGGAIMNSAAHQHVKEIRSSRREKNPTRQSLTINYGFQLGRFFLRTQSRVRECFKLIKTV